MNIFALHDDPKQAAQWHLDRHIVKMIIEYAQLMSTAHRLLDGKPTEFYLPNGKTQIINLLRGEHVSLREAVEGGYQVAEGRSIKKTEKYEIVNPVCYNASHQNHPCGVWARESDSNYRWLFRLFDECAAEYSHRYGKIHKTWSDLHDFLREPPRNISAGDLTPFACAMGDEFKVHDDPITSYQNYYLGPKVAFAKWTNRPAPDWFKAGIKDYDASNFERTSSVGRSKTKNA